MPVDKLSKPEQADDQNRRFSDERTDRRNHEHLTNEHDQISEEDIRNVITNIGTSDEADGTGFAVQTPGGPDIDVDKIIKEETSPDEHDKP